MSKNIEISNASFYSALVVLGALLISLVVPLPNKVQAETTEIEIVATTEKAESLAQTGTGKMPLLFEENKGQTDGRAKFVSRGAGYTLYLAENEAVFSLQVPSPESEVQSLSKNPKTENRRPKNFSDTLRMKFAGANSNPLVSGAEPSATKTNYYAGKKRFENVPNYEKVIYRNLYAGIDAVFYGNQNNQLEYDFIVAPEVDPDLIGLEFEGARAASVDEQGNLLIKTANTELVQQKPVAFQEIDGVKREIEVRYVINESSKPVRYRISFALGEYDRSQPLVIDPALKYLTYLGGTGVESLTDLVIDAQGNVYAVGSTSSLDFPRSGARDERDGKGVYVAKIDPTGTDAIYITILEGNGDDSGSAIAIDPANNVYIAGTATRSFPVTDGAYTTVLGIRPDEGFVAKLNPNGNIVYATYFGGAEGVDLISGIAADSSGKAYFTGLTWSGISFPQKNRYQGCGYGNATNSQDAFFSVLNAAGSDITYSTCFGASFFEGAEEGDAIALDSANNAYITGSTDRQGFPTKNAAQSTIGGGIDAFVIKFNPTLSGEDSLIYSTFLGGSGTDQGFDIAVSPNGMASVTGITGSLNFPLKNAFDTTNQINEAFVAQYNSSGALINSSFLGGSDQDQGKGIALGNGGTIYVTGNTLSNDFPLATPFQSTRRGGFDAFVAKIRFGANNNPGVASSSFLGGSGNDSGNAVAVKGKFIFVGGSTDSNNLLTTPGALKATSNASASVPDGFVAKILDSHKDTVGTFNPTNTLFSLRNILAAGAADLTVDRGAAGDIPVAGDFNGDGVDSVSTFNGGVWKIQNLNIPGSGYSTGVTTVNFGVPGDLPIVGDWDGDGIDSVGVFRPSSGQFFLTNLLTLNPPINLTINFGTFEDLPLAGDWDADGVDSVGFFRHPSGPFFLTNENVSSPNVFFTGNFGITSDLPVAGDFDGNGTDTIGVWRSSTATFVLSNNNVNTSNTFIFGGSSDTTPVTGDWDGKPNQ